MRRWQRALAMASLGALVTAGSAVSGHAPAARALESAPALVAAVPKPDSVAIPAHLASPRLTLVGASEKGVVVRQDPIGRYNPSRFFSGASGGELTRRAVMDETIGIGTSPTDVVGVVGDAVGWTTMVPGAGVHPAEFHQLNLLTGQDTDEGEGAPSFAFTGDAWLSVSPVSYVDWPPDPRTLRRYTLRSENPVVPGDNIQVHDVSATSTGGRPRRPVTAPTPFWPRMTPPTIIIPPTAWCWSIWLAVWPRRWSPTGRT